MQVLPVCYDLARSPPTFDFVSFLVGAEMARLDAGAGRIELHIAPGPNHGFRADTLPPPDPAHRRRLLAAIVEPMAHLLPSVAGVIVHSGRPDLPPGTYGLNRGRYGFPVKVAAAARGLYPLRAAPAGMALPCPAADCITITLRECEWWPTRNSDLAQWLVVAAGLRARGFVPVFVRDTAMADVPIPGQLTWPAASHNLYCRARLYADAALNLFVNNGPAWLSWFMGAPTLIAKMISAEAPAVSAEFFAGCGLRPGFDLPNARPRQRIVWTDDRADPVLAAVDAVLA